MPYSSYYSLSQDGVSTITTASGAQRGAANVSLGNGINIVFYYDIATNRIVANIVSANGIAGTPVAISTGSVNIPLSTSGDVAPVSAVRLANGNIVVVWASNETTQYVYHRIFDSNLNPVTDARIAEGLAVSSVRPDVAALPGGGFVIAWQSNFAGYQSIFYRRYADSGDGLDSTSGIALAIGQGNDQAPSVAVLADGGFAIGWHRATGGNSAIWGAVINADSSVRTAPFEVDATGSINREVEVTARGDGGFTFLYQDSQWISSNVSAVNFTATGTPSPAIPATDASGIFETDVAAAMSPEGFVAFAYRVSFNNGDIFGGLIAPDGTRLATNVAIQNFTLDYEGVPSVAWNDGGSFTVTYEQAPTAAGETDIFRRTVNITRYTTGDAANDTINFAYSAIRNSIDGGDGNDILIGGPAQDFLQGGNQDDILVGSGGNDILDGGTGANTMQGGTGDDVYNVRNITDSVVEFANEGNDVVSSSLLSYTLPSNVEHLSYGGSAHGSPLIFIGNALNNNILGGTGSDLLIGLEGDDQLSDGAFFTGNNPDTMIGGPGNDTYSVHAIGASTIELPGEGVDTIFTNISIYALQANIENLTSQPNSAHAAFVGNELDNVITGANSTDSLFGRAGNDTLIGGIGLPNTMLGQEGDDVYIVSATGDSVIEFANEGIDRVETAAGSFTLRDHVENLVYTGVGDFIGVGSDGTNNSIRSGAGADQLNGMGGDDIIIGGSGTDILQGGSGADQFRYEGGETGIDRILDFVSGTDKIALSSTFFTPTGTVDFVSGTAATSTNSTILYDPTTGIVYYDDDGNGTGAAVALAQLNPGQTFTAGDFLFY